MAAPTNTKDLQTSMEATTTTMTRTETAPRLTDTRVRITKCSHLNITVSSSSPSRHFLLISVITHLQHRLQFLMEGLSPGIQLIQLTMGLEVRHHNHTEGRDLVPETTCDECHQIWFLNNTGLTRESPICLHLPYITHHHQTRQLA